MSNSCLPASVSIIAVNFNGIQYLDNFFTSLFEQDLYRCEVIFVDNCSSDGSCEYVKDKWPEVKIYEMESNIGYAGAVNFGYQVSCGDLILICNNDIEFRKLAIINLANFILSSEQIGIVQPKPLLGEDTNAIDSCGSYWTFTGFNYHYGNYKSAHDLRYGRPLKIYSVKGMCMMVKRSLIEKVGLFDGDFWCYFEETDFCHRAILSGMESWYYPGAEIVHINGGTSRSFNNSVIEFHSFKNRLCSYLKNMEMKQLIFVLPTYICLTLCWSVASMVRGRFANSLSPLKAIYWNILNIKKTLRKRAKIYTKIVRPGSNERLKGVTFNPPFRYYLSFFSSLKNFEDPNL